MKERLTEIGIFIIGGIGLFILFTLLYNGPSIVFNKLAGIVQNALR